MGKAVGPWRIGMAHRTAPGLLRTVRDPRELHGGCIGRELGAARIDFYRDLRLYWAGQAFTKLGLYHATTLRRGDRTSRGLAIGTATLAEARRIYPHARLRRGVHAGDHEFGVAELSVYQRTGYESGKQLVLWFGADDRLVAISTGVSGC